MFLLTRKFHRYFLATILLIGLGLRVASVQHGYPPNHPDEPVVYSLAYDVIKNRTLRPPRFDYPMFSMLVNTFSYLSFFIPFSLAKAALLNPGAFGQNLGHLQVFLDSYVLRGPVNPVLLWGRWVSVFWGTATILMTYLLAKEIFGKQVGLVAAFLLSVNYRHLIASVLTLPDVFNTFLHVAAFWVFLKLWRTPSRKGYLWSGILIGLVVATKYQAMIGLPFFLIHCQKAFQGKCRQKIIGRFFSQDFFLAGLAALVAFFLVNPYILLDFRQAYDWITWDAVRYEVGVLRLRLTPLWYLYDIILGRPLAWTVFLGLILGLLLKKYRWPVFLILSLFLASFFMLHIYTHGCLYGRNYTPLLPFFLSLAGFGVVKLARGRWGLTILLTILVSFNSLKLSLPTAYFWSKDWNLNCVRQWMMKNLKSGDKVGIIPPTPMDAFERNKKIAWVFFEPKADFTLPEVQEAGIDFLVINIDRYGSHTLHWLDADNQFFAIPMEVLDNSLVGLVLKEISRHASFSCLKPWVVPDHNFLVVKVPEKQKSPLGKPLVVYSFDENDGRFSSDWQITTLGESDATGFSWQEGSVCRSGGCLRVPAGLNYIHNPARFVSKAIPVEPGKKYFVEGWLKADKELLAEEKDGFLRADFYENKDLPEGRRGLTTALSGRVWGEAAWQKKWLVVVAPEGANYLRLSLQHKSATIGFWYDDIKVFVGEATTEEQIVANRTEIDGHYLYSETIF